MACSVVAVVEELIQCSSMGYRRMSEMSSGVHIVIRVVGKRVRMSRKHISTTRDNSRHRRGIEESVQRDDNGKEECDIYQI